MLSQAPLKQTSLLNKSLCAVLVFFGTSIASVLIIHFYLAMNEYSAIVSRLFALCGVVLMFSIVIYVGVNVLLLLEYRIIQNNRFREDNVEVLTRFSEEDAEEDSDSQAANMFLSGSSLNEISLAIHGKKGGYYSNLVKESLERKGINV